MTIRSVRFLLLTLLSTYTLSGQTGTVSGVVMLPDTSYWGGIAVAVLGQNKSTVTQPNGQFTLTGVAAGSISVQAGKIFYANARKDTTLSPGGTTAISLTLSTYVVDTTSEHQTGRYSTAVTNNGNVGALNHFVEPGDPGFRWNGQQQLFEASLMMGVDTTRVSDAARFIFGVAQDNLDQDFLSLSDIVVRGHGADSTELVTMYNDSRSNLPPGIPSQPLGIRVTQETYSFGDTVHHGFLIVKLTLTNTTTVTLNNLLVGWFIDWNTGADTANRGGIVFAQNTIPGINGGNPFDVELAYIRNSPSNTPYAGISPLSQPKFRAARIASNSQEIVVGAPGGGLTEANKYRYMRNRRDTLTYADYGVPEDLSMVLSVGGLSSATYDSSFFTLPPQTSVTVGFAFVGGNDSSQFVGNALQAQKKWVRLGQEIVGLPGEPQFLADRTLLNIGEVSIGASRTDSVTITNPGTATLSIGSVASTNPLFTVVPQTADITPLTSRKFYVTFSPTSIGSQAGDIIFTHNGITSPDTVGVTGVGRTEIFGTYNVGLAHQLRTLGDVANLLNFGQLIGAATFYLTDVSYADSLIDFSSINGSSPQNTVTLRPAPGVNTVLNLRGTSAVPAGMRFTGVSNFSLDGWNGTSPSSTRSMTIAIDTTSLTLTTGVVVLGTTRNFTVMNCVVRGYRTPGSAATAILVDSLAGQSPDSNIIFRNLAISRAREGLTIRGRTLPNRNQAITVRDCLFGGTGSESLIQTGLHLSHTDGGNIENNVVNGINTSGFGETTDAVGFRFGPQNSNVRIYRNKVFNVTKSGSGSGVAVGIQAEGQSGLPTRYKIWNNMVWNIFATQSTNASSFGGPVQGLSLPYATLDTVYYNSVWISGTSVSNNHSSALYIVGPSTAESTRTTVWNNVFVNTSTMGAIGRSPVVKYFDGQGASYSSADRNDYYSSGSRGAIAAVGDLSTTPMFLSTLIAFKARTGHDNNSLSIDPRFDPTNLLYIQTGRATPVESGGTPLAGITTDIDGNVRNTTAPDIGAHEGVFIPYSLRQMSAVFDSVLRRITILWGTALESPSKMEEKQMATSDIVSSARAEVSSTMAIGETPTSILTGYSLHRSVSGSPFVLFDSVNATASSYMDGAIGSQAATYRYFLRARFDDGISAPSETVSVAVPPAVGVEEPQSLPSVYALEQNYPNPFNPVTIIKYQIPVRSMVNLRIYNVLGQEIATLVNEEIQPGYHAELWEGENSRGNALSSGVYFYRIEARAVTGADVFIRTMKMVVIK